MRHGKAASPYIQRSKNSELGFRRRELMFALGSVSANGVLWAVSCRYGFADWLKFG